jgi:hypothetical protein
MGERVTPDIMEMFCTIDQIQLYPHAPPRALEVLYSSRIQPSKQNGTACMERGDRACDIVIIIPNSLHLSSAIENMEIKLTSLLPCVQNPVL